MKKAICLLAFFLGFCINSSAETVLFDATIEKNELQLNIEWLNSDFLNIGLVPDGMLYSSSEDIAEKCILLTVRTKDDGTYNNTIILPDLFSGGKYNIFVTDGSRKIQKELFYINTKDNELKEVIKLMNADSISLDEFDKLTQNNSGKLGVDAEDYNRYSENIVSILYENRGGYTISSYSDMLKTAVITEILKELEDIEVIDEIVKENCSAFGIDYDVDYANESAETRKLFINSYLISDFSKGNYGEVFKSKLIFQKLSAASSYTEYAKIIVNYKEYLEIDYSEYDTLTAEGKSVVMSKMFVAKIYDTEIIAQEFLKYVKEQKKIFATVQKPQYGGGGGGNGGGGGGNISISGDLSPTEIISSIRKDIFCDIKGHWAESYIVSLYERGVIDGFLDGSFRPSELVTRAQFVKMLCVVMNYKGIDEVVFEDVTKDDWCYELVASAYNEGIITGYNNRFAPHENITRQDCAVIMKNVLDINGIKDKAEIEFKDVNEISDYAMNSVEILSAKRIINGYEDNTFRPFDNATRAEAAKMIHSLIDTLSEVK